MTVREQLFNYIPKRFFVEGLKENRIGHIKLAFVREVINPMIIRSTDAESTIALVSIDGRELAEIPPRKLKSREKLLGLMICREFGVVDEKVRYNVFEGAEYLNNPNSILFGDTSTKAGDTAGLVSRAIYDWAYSLRDVKDITDKLQHNALSEAGTMIDETTGEMRQSLYSTEYILPNTFFPHFITVDNITPELFVHLLSCVLNQHRYGAQTTTTANNMNNHLVAIGFSDFEKPINSYTVSKAWRKQAQENKEQQNPQGDLQPSISGADETPTLESVKEFVRGQMTTQYRNGLLTEEKTVELINWINKLWDGFDDVRSKTDESKMVDVLKSEPLTQAYATAKANVDSYLKEIKMVSGRAGEDKADKVIQAISALKSEGKDVSKEEVLAKVTKGATRKKEKGEYQKIVEEQLAAMESENENPADKN